ncbi:MAG: CoA-binding protein [Rhodobacteraceae bacterium]|nr:CoA-binding protein [Paracoccaceae bacterium]
MNPSDDEIRSILATTRVIAVVGFSPDPARPSNGVARFLCRKGVRVIPVNPAIAGQIHLGEEVRPDLTAITPDIPVDMVDIFRRPEFVPPVVEEALATLPALRTVWMQLGVVNAAAAGRARAAGLRVVMDRCPAIEWPRLLG